MTTLKLDLSAADLRSWLAEQVAGYVQRPAADIKPDVHLASYGLDSVYALTLTGEIEDQLGITLEPTVMWDYDTIDALATLLLQTLHEESAA